MLAKEIYSILLKVNFKILIIHYFLYISSNTLVFVNAKQKRKYSI